MVQPNGATTQKRTVSGGSLVMLSIVVGCCLSGGSGYVTPRMAYAAGEAEIEYAKGIVEYSNRQYLNALDHFRKAADRAPDNPDAQFYLGLTLRRLGEFAEAIVALERALQLDPSKAYIHHHLGLAFFFDKRYEDALLQFQQAEQFDTQKIETHYYLGYTRYHLKQYEQVLAPMQRVIELDPALAPSAHYYRGLALYALERDKQARDAFDAVVAANPQSSAAHNAERYIVALQRREREQRLYQVQASIGYQHDDNVILEPNDTSLLDIPSGKSDSRMVFSLLGRLVPLRTPQWRAGAEFNMFQSVHFTLSEFDVQSYTAGLFGRLKMDRVTLHLAASSNVTFLDSRFLSDYDLFSSAVTLQPSATIHQTEALFAVVTLRVRYSDYFDSLPQGQQASVRDRDGWTVRTGADQYVVFNRGRALARLSYRYEGNRAAGTDWEYDSHQIGLGLQTTVWEGFTFNVDWGYARFDYKHINSFDVLLFGELTAADTQKRQDDRLSAAITLTQALGRFFFLSLNWSHTTNFSNIAFFEYDRNVIALTLTGRY